MVPYQGLPELHFGHNASSIEATGNWCFNFEYAAELERGLDAHHVGASLVTRCYCPGVITALGAC